MIVKQFLLTIWIIQKLEIIIIVNDNYNYNDNIIIV
jgi:hypothetical protein